MLKVTVNFHSILTDRSQLAAHPFYHRFYSGVRKELEDSLKAFVALLVVLSDFFFFGH